jgi:hypothetical protein
MEDIALCKALIEVGLRKTSAIDFFQATREHFESYDDPYHMTFGRFKGKPIFNVPSRYLKWCVEENIYGKVWADDLRDGFVTIGLLED